MHRSCNVIACTGFYEQMEIDLVDKCTISVIQNGREVVKHALSAFRITFQSQAGNMPGPAYNQRYESRQPIEWDADP